MKAAIIQARMGSTRFPEKIFADLAGKPLIWHVVDRLKYCILIDKMLIATTTDQNDNRLAEWAEKESLLIYRGSEDDVLNRYFMAAKSIRLTENDIIIRITADDPFKEPSLIDKVIEVVENGEADFACNNNPPTFPEGLDCEVFTMSVLETAEKQSTDLYEREHVTQYMYRHPEQFKSKNIAQKDDLSYLRFTIDTPTDYQMVQTVYNHLYKDDKIFVLNDILELFKKHPEIQVMNSNEPRSAMYKNTCRKNQHGKN